MSSVFKEFEQLKADLIQAYDNKGMRASGRWADALEVVQSENKVTLFGLDYSRQLEEGRKPTTNSGNGALYDAILQWIDDKNISAKLNNEITKTQLAFLITRKIHREGWDRKGFGGVELISEVVTEERINSIIEKYGQEQTLIFTSDILNTLKELAQ